MPHWAAQGFRLVGRLRQTTAPWAGLIHRSPCCTKVTQIHVAFLNVFVDVVVGTQASAVVCEEDIKISSHVAKRSSHVANGQACESVVPSLVFYRLLSTPRQRHKNVKYGPRASFSARTASWTGNRMNHSRLPRGRYGLETYPPAHANEPRGDPASRSFSARDVYRSQEKKGEQVSVERRSQRGLIYRAPLWPATMLIRH